MSIIFNKATQIRGRSPSALERWAPIPIRLMVGYGFMAHGCAMLVRGPEHFVEILHDLGVPMAELMGWVIIVIELVLSIFRGQHLLSRPQ